MNIIQRAVRRIVRATLDHAPEWVWAGTDGGNGVSGTIQVAGTSKPAENVLMVYGCIMARREAIGGVPLRISDANDNVIESGALADLLRQPNRAMNWDAYVRVLETYNTLYNAMAVAKVSSMPGRPPDELVPLSPAFLQPVLGVHAPTGTLRAMGWKYNDPFTGAERTFQPEELMIHQGFNPHAPLNFLNPLTVLKRTIQSELAARETNLADWQNSAMPPAVLESDRNLNKTQADEIRDAYNDIHQGIKNRSKIGVLWGGLKFHATGLSPKEMEYLAGLKFLRTDYYIAFRVKPAMVGDMVGETGLSQGNATDQQKVEWWEDVGLPELDLIAGMHQTLAESHDWGTTISMRPARGLTRSEQLVRQHSLVRRPSAPASRIYVWFNENSIAPLVRHRLSKIDSAGKLISFGWKPDDATAFVDLGAPPHADNIARVPFSMTPIGEDAELPGGTENGKTEKGKTEDGRADHATALKTLDRIEEICREEAVVPRKYKALRQAFDKFIAPREKAAAKKISRFFMEQRDRVRERFTATLARATTPPPVSDAGKSQSEILKAIFPKSEENPSLVARLAPLWSEHLRDGWNFFNQESGADEKVNPFKVDDPAVMKALERRKIQGTAMNDTTEEDLRDLIRKAFEEGDSTVQLGDRIEAYYKANCWGENTHRPATAARTQTSGIVNEGRMLSARETGTNLKKAWLHGGSAEPRPDHVAMQQKYLAAPIGVDEEFVLNGNSCDAPGDSSLPVGETANCTCMVVFVKGPGGDVGENS